MRSLASVLVVLLVIFENGRSFSYDKKVSITKVARKLVNVHQSQAANSRKLASRSDTDSLVEVPKGGIPPWVAPFGTAALGGLLFGSDIGCSSSVVRILGSGESDFGALSALDLGQIASSSLLGAMISSGLLVFLGDTKIGRKLEFQLASVLFLSGTAIQALSPTLALVYIGNFPFLFLLILFQLLQFIEY